MAPAESPSKNLAPIEPAAAAHVMGTPEAAPRARRRYAAFWFAVHVNTFVWLGDGLLLVRERPEYPKAAAQGLFAALFLSTVVFGCVGLLFEAAAALSRATGSPRLSVRARRWLFEGSARDHGRRIATLLAIPGVLGLYMVATFFASHRVIVGMARPEFAALALVGAQLLLLTAAVFLFFPARGVGLWGARGLIRVPFLRRAWQILLLLLGFAAIALGSFVYRYREPLSYLPWRPIVQVAISLVLGGAIALLPRRLKLTAAVVWPLGLVVAGCVAAGAVATLSLSTTTGYARRIAEHSSLAGGVAYSVLRAALDRDHDGYISVLGDGDCAPSDPARNPGATDVPGNKIDEDCDGFDLDPSTLAPRGARGFAVPESLPRRPPIVLLTIDAFAANRLKHLGGARGVTPNLDRLVDRSVFFSNCFSQGPSTRLSFPSMFTSRWDSQIHQQLVGKHPFPIDASETMLADVLAGSGYETIAVLGDSYFTEKRWRGITRGFSKVVNSAISGPDRPPHNGARVTDAVINELRARHSRPTFLWAHYYDAHSPHVQPEDMPVFGKARSDVYDAELMLVDRDVGKVIDAIDEIYKGEALVIVTADHGIAFDPPKHEKFNYGYDLSSAVLHVPLVFHASFIPKREVGSVVSTMDIMPTLLNLLRVATLAPLEGTSLVPELLRGEHSRPPELMHQMFLEERLWKSEEPLERVALRTDRFNLLQDRKTGFFELYDYRRDALETRDLTLDPAFATTLRDLKRQLALLVYVSRKPDADRDRDKDKEKDKEHASEKAEP
jgi:arylsulfatase A-like enzyme